MRRIKQLRAPPTLLLWALSQHSRQPGPPLVELMSPKLHLTKRAAAAGRVSESLEQPLGKTNWPGRWEFAWAAWLSSQNPLLCESLPGGNCIIDFKEHLLGLNVKHTFKSNIMDKRASELVSEMKRKWTTVPSAASGLCEKKPHLRDSCGLKARTRLGSWQFHLKCL